MSSRSVSQASNHSQSKKSLSPARQTLTENERKELQSLSVQELRARLILSNKNRTFSKSKEIDDIIHNKTKNDANNQIDQFETELAQNISFIYKMNGETEKGYKEEFNARIDVLRHAIDSAFQDLQAQQKKELTDLLIQRDLEIQITKTKVPQKIRELRSIADTLATTHQYEQAIEYDEEANSLHDLTQMQTIQKIEKAFSQHQKQLFIKFKNELLILETRYKNSENAIKQQIDHERCVQAKRFEVDVKNTLQKEIRKTIQQFRNTNQIEITFRLKTEIVNRLTKVCIKVLSDFGVNTRFMESFNPSLNLL